MFQTELLLQKELLKQGEETGTPVARTLKQQIEVKSQREDAGCSDRG